MRVTKSWTPVFSIAIACAFLACSGDDERSDRLPILGNVEVIDDDTIYHTIPDFQFVDQDSQIITPSTFAGKIYVTDFFFTSCPSICPVVRKQMMRIYDKYRTDERVMLISHSIDTRRDSVPRLKEYADKLGIDADKWHLVTGDKDEIYSLANEYFIVAIEDANAPGGFDHSGKVILVDDKKQVRSWCNGTDEDEMTEFLKDIDLLLNESD